MIFSNKIHFIVFIFVLVVVQASYSETIQLRSSPYQAQFAAEFPGTPEMTTMPNPAFPEIIYYVYNYTDPKTSESYAATIYQIPEHMGTIDRATQQSMIDTAVEEQLDRAEAFTGVSNNITTDTGRSYQGNPSRYVENTRHSNGIEIRSFYRAVAYGRVFVVAWALVIGGPEDTLRGRSFVNSLQSQ